MKTKKKETFEASLKKLEKIVGQLEDGDLPLEESLKLFETGVKLSRECRERLDQAERRIEMLIEDSGGEPLLQPLEAEDEAGDEKPAVKKRIVFENDEEPF